MRGGRSLLILLVVALGLGAYIYFVESQRDPTETDAKEKLFAVTASDINELNIRKGSTTTALRKDGDAWGLTAPVTTPASSSAVEPVVNGLETIEIDRVIEENATNLAPFGLDAPPLSIGFRTADGTAHELHLGSKTPTGSGIYARVDGNPRVLLVAAFHEQTFDKTPFDLRDRQVLAITAGDAERVTLTSRNATPVELRRSEGAWRLAAPLEARADASVAEGLVNRLTTAQMSSVISEGNPPTPAELRTYGLDAPRLVATVGSGSNTATLAIGAARDEASAYARDLSRPIVFTVDAALLTDLQKGPDDLRVKDIFELNAFSAQSLDVTHGATVVAYAKSSTPAADNASEAPAPTWSRTKPTAGEVNQTALTDLLNTLSSLRAERFVAQTPAGGEDIVVAARHGASDAASEERVTLRRVGEVTYALRAGDPGAAIIPSAQFDTVLSQLKTLTSTP